ncbi:hypothetical protein AAVH_33058 [Aphelenchoides avenae]|nr:hypothetical protein AAVH_33058 [Aphelenchus avenae]
MPLPRIDAVAWITRKDHRVTPCEMHSFVNARQWKRMDVYKWSVEFERFDSRRTAHILQRLVKDL